jgi:phosphatidylserine decarboxylase
MPLWPQINQYKKSLLLISGGSLVTGIGVYNYLKDRSKCQEYDLSSTKFLALKFIPWNVMSRCAGYFASLEIPVFLRSPLYGSFSFLFGCNLDEMKAANLKTFPTFNHFFARELKDGARQIDRSSLVSSPCDGKVLVTGKISFDPFLEHFMIDQVKGVSYPLSHLIGRKELETMASDKKDIYYCTMYLSPATYHRFHSPINNWKIDNVRHINGELFPVAPWFMKVVKEVSFLNEKVIFSGNWKHGRFSMIPVGATNVGSIIYNSSAKDLCAKRMQMGEELGRFQLGSMVILVFSMPNSFEWLVSPGQNVKLGQSLLQKRSEGGWLSYLSSFVFSK